MKKRLTNNLGLKLLAFLLAGFMWFLVVNIDDPITEKTYTGIKVKVTNEDVVTSSNRTYQIVDNTQTVSVVVSAKRSVLTKLKADDIEATANMKELSMETQVPIEISIDKYSGRYESAYSTPRNLQVKIEEESRNSYPITPTSTGTVRGGYVVGTMTADPQKITFRGPKTIIDSISKVVADVDVSGLSEDSRLEANLVLYDANDNVIDQTLLSNNLGKEGVYVDVSLYKIKSIPVTIDDTNIKAKTGYTIESITTEPSQIDVAGEQDALDLADEIEIPADALVATDLTERTELTVDVTTYLPEDVSLADSNAGNVVVTIAVTQPGTQIYEISTSAITVSNLASNLEVVYNNAVDLSVEIRGPEATLKNYKIAKKVSIDLKDCKEPGTYTVPVKVNLPEGCTLENNLEVKVTLEKKG